MFIYFSDAQTIVLGAPPTTTGCSDNQNIVLVTHPTGVFISNIEYNTPQGCLFPIFNTIPTGCSDNQNIVLVTHPTGVFISNIQYMDYSFRYTPPRGVFLSVPYLDYGFWSMAI